MTTPGGRQLLWSSPGIEPVTSCCRRSVLCGVIDATTTAQGSSTLPCSAEPSPAPDSNRRPLRSRPRSSRTGPEHWHPTPRNPENPRLIGGFAEAADGCRTRDLELGKLALYQLSYRRMMQGNPC